MNSTIWGPPTWFFLHTVTLKYPDNPSDSDKNNFREFISVIGKNLPCDICRHNFFIHIKYHPLTDQILNSRTSLFKWMVDIHNSVNKLKNKREYSYEEAWADMRNKYNLENNMVNIRESFGKSGKPIFLILFVIIIIIIIFVVYSKYKSK